jgi:phage shock protein E
MTFRLAFAPFLASLGFTACGPDPVSSEAHALVERGARLVDVRSSLEFASGHIDGAVNIPLDQLKTRMAEVGPKTEPVVVYCRSGQRSASAKRTLEASGYTEVFDLGAMARW